MPLRDAGAALEAGGLLIHLMDQLKAEGISLPDAEWTKERLQRKTPEAVQQLSHGLDRALSQDGEVPMLIDLETLTGMHQRRVQRTLPQLCSYLGQAPETFRSMRQRVRLGQAAHLLGADNASTEDVARVLGFASPTGFCRAVRRFGLPTPSQLRAA